MASKRRRAKLRPDWVGDDYDNSKKAGDAISTVKTNENKPQDSSKQDTRKNSESVSSVPALGEADSSTASSSHRTAKRKCMAESSKAESSQDEHLRPLTPGEIIALSMPLLQFKGSLFYSYNSGDCSLLCEDIMTTLLADGSQLHVGFDLEWPVTFVSGSTCKVALVQICVSEDKCYLFHIAAMGEFPRALKTLISHPRVIKYGINIEADFWKLERDYDIQVRDIIRRSVKDLSVIANEKLKSSERWNLDGLCRNVLQKRLDKDVSVRCGKWEEYPLSEEQKQYAAADAYACLLLANYLLKL